MAPGFYENLEKLDQAQCVPGANGLATRDLSAIIYRHALTFGRNGLDEKELPPVKPADRGHYHAECAEFWIILAGQISYKIEGQAPFVADAGDVVYVPRFTYHLPRFYGPGPACRLAMNGYPEVGHLFDVVPAEASSH